MSILDWFKKPKYDRSQQEVQLLMQNAVIPEHAKKKGFGSATATAISLPRFSSKSRGSSRAAPKRSDPIVVPSTKTVFFVESSFKLPPTFILNGYPRSGVVKRNMSAQFGEETILIKNVQSEFKKTVRLEAGQRGSIEIIAKLGLEIPDNLELEFDFKTRKAKRKAKSKKRKPSIQKMVRNTEITPSSTMPLKPALAPLAVNPEKPAEPSSAAPNSQETA